jgi:uncharacterized protein GlcG (DUF336 family)
VPLPLPVLFETVTTTGLEVALTFDLSISTAVKAWTPLLAVVVFHEIWNGALAIAVPMLAPSNLNCTLATPALAEAFADTVMVFATTNPLLGEVIVIEGGVLILDTFTTTAAEVARLPKVSDATANKVWVPFVALLEFQLNVYGAMVTAGPAGLPSTSNSTDAIAAPLPAALAEIAVVPVTVAPEAGDVIATVGGFPLLAVFETFTVTGFEVAATFNLSVTTAVKVCTPLLAVVVFHEIWNGALAIAVPMLAPSNLNCTLATPALAEAFADAVMVFVTTNLLLGEVIVIDGGVLIFDTFTTTGAEVARFPKLSDATATKVW